MRFDNSISELQKKRTRRLVSLSWSSGNVLTAGTERARMWASPVHRNSSLDSSRNFVRDPKSKVSEYLWLQTCRTQWEVETQIIHQGDSLFLFDQISNWSFGRTCLSLSGSYASLLTTNHTYSVIQELNTCCRFASTEKLIRNRSLQY